MDIRWLHECFKNFLGQTDTTTSESPGCPPPIEPIITTSAPQTGYFDLPGEVRNQIMDLVLKPGDIHFSRNSTQADQAPPGVQLLASNRQAYTEGCGIFYSENTFHIPPGPIACTERVLEQYQPQHLALIRRLTLHVGLHDLGYFGDLRQFDKTTLDDVGYVGDLKQSNKRTHRLSITWQSFNDMNSCLEELWRSKLLYVREHFHNLKEFRIVFWDLDYDVWITDDAQKVSFIQPHVLRANEATVPGPYGEAVPKQVVTFVYNGEDINTALRHLPMNVEYLCYLRMSGDNEVFRGRRAYGELLLEAAFQTQRDVLLWEVFDCSLDVEDKLPDLMARHELRIRR